MLSLKPVKTSFFGTAKTLISGVAKKVKKARVRSRAEKMLKSIETDCKHILLTRFPEKRLDEIARLNGIRLKVYVPETGSWRNMTREEKIRAIAKRLSFEKIVRYARFYRVRYKDVVQLMESEKKKIKQWLENEIRVIEQKPAVPGENEKARWKTKTKYVVLKGTIQRQDKKKKKKRK